MFRYYGVGWLVNTSDFYLRNINLYFWESLGKVLSIKLSLTFSGLHFIIFAYFTNKTTMTCSVIKIFLI